MGNVARRPSPEIIKNSSQQLKKLQIRSLFHSHPVSDFEWKLSGKPRYLEGARY